MKKALAKRIRNVAASLPEQWEKEWEVATMSGADANLCYIGKQKPFSDDQIVEFNCPRFVLVNHETRLKDGVKKYGSKFIGQYLQPYFKDFVNGKA